MKKSQTWSVDIIFAVFIFTAGVVLFYLYVTNFFAYHTDVTGDLFKEGDKIANNIMSEGTPIDWNESNVISIGILSNDKINKTKLERFYNMTNSSYAGYENSRSLFGTKYHYYFFLDDPFDFTCVPDCTGRQCGPDPEGCGTSCGTCSPISSKTDIVSAIDVSASMIEPGGNGMKFLNCTPNITSTTTKFVDDCCEQNNNCQTSSDCAKCNLGTIDPLTNTCNMNIFFPLCCSLNNNCTDEGSCNYCANFTNKTWSWDGWHANPAYDYSYCYIPGTSRSMFVGYGCSWSQQACENWCNGTYIPPSGDVSSSSKCQAVLNQGCCSTHDCSTAAGCNQCHGGWLDSSGVCYLSSYLPDCCRGRSCPSSFSDCNTTCNLDFQIYHSSGYTYCNNKGWQVSWNGYPQIYGSCTNYYGFLNPSINKDFCEKQCEGIFGLMSKWDFVKNAHITSGIGLIDNITIGSENRMGIVTYSQNVENIVPLTNDTTLLKNFVSGLTIRNTGNTNICQAINQSIELLKSSTNPKVIILITDGRLNVFCNGTSVPSGDPVIQANANQEAIHMAYIANNTYGIKVYAIGIGISSSLDSATLTSIANESGGTYTYSSTEDLMNVYSRIIMPHCDDTTGQCSVSSTTSSTSISSVSSSPLISTLSSPPPTKIDGIGKPGVNSSNVIQVENPKNLVKITRFTIYNNKPTNAYVYIWSKE